MSERIQPWQLFNCLLSRAGAAIAEQPLLLLFANTSHFWSWRGQPTIFDPHGKYARQWDQGITGLGSWYWKPTIFVSGWIISSYLPVVFGSRNPRSPAEAILGLFGINSSCDQGMSPVWGVRECWPCWCPWALSSPQLCIRWATAPPFFLEDLRIRKIRQVRPMSSWCESGLGI